MSDNFELATVALFDRLTGLPGIQYATRVLEDWDNNAPAKQPALMLTSSTIAEFSPNAGLQGLITPLWKMQQFAIVYVQSPSKNTPPSSILNPLISRICNALLKQAPEAQSPYARFVANAPGSMCTTLGGLTAYCRAFGTIDRIEGLVGHVSVAKIPIEMVLPS